MTDREMLELAALSNLEHDNYERSHKGYENRQADIALIRAALDEYRAMVAAVEQIDPATLPGITVAQRCALGRFAKPRPAGDAQPVVWVAADTLTSPHPACVSSLAYMSQLDREQGREYVPLYAAPVAAQTADELAECRSAVADEVLALLERSLAVIQHDIDEIGGCDHSVGICCCELIHLADDIRAAMQRTSDGGAA